MIKKSNIKIWKRAEDESKGVEIEKMSKKIPGKTWVVDSIREFDSNISWFRHMQNHGFCKMFKKNENLNIS